MDMSALSPRIRKMEEAEPPIAIELLKLHDSQVHDLASKPVLTMTDDAVEDTDWEQFKLEQNKNLG